MTRRLIIIPIVHTSTDLGSLSEPVKARYLKQFGPAIWSRRQQLVERLWKDIRRRISRLKLDYRKVRIYQDGLPVCGKELEIVRELADAGSRNHQLVFWALRKGAKLVGTEDPELLIREYQGHRRQIDAAETGKPVQGPTRTEMATLLESRDRFIAERISQTLQEGETGLAFLGAAHRLDAVRDGGIQVETLT